MTKFKRLVTYGCSYTAGEELPDETCIPGADEIKKMQGREVWWKTLFEKYPEMDKFEYIKLCKSHAWPRHLADKIGIPCDNRAFPGISIYNMIYDIDRDLANGDILDTDLVILGTTSPNRLIYINPSDGEGVMHLGYLHFWPQDLKHGYPFFIKWMNDPTIVFHYSMALRTLLYMAQTRLKNQLYFVECDAQALHITKFIEPPLNPSRIETLEPAYLDFKNSGLMLSERSLYFDQPAEYELAFGHLSEAAHIDWVKHLYENCQRMGLTS